MNELVRDVPLTPESYPQSEYASALFGLAVTMPLVLDLDGTLIAGDLLYKSFVSILRRNPLVVFQCAAWLLRGRAALKRQLALRARIDWDRLRELMGQVKRASELRLESMALCSRRPAPASFFDWVASIAPINHLPVGPEIVDYFQAVKTEVEKRVAGGEGAIHKEKYRLFFDGIMNWNKVGWLAEKFAQYDAAVIAGRYTHMAFWQEPGLIDPQDPVLGMAQNYLVCPNNHSAPILISQILKLCEQYEVDGMVLHASRTCRAFTNPQFLIADAASKRLGIQTSTFEGDVTDESFYKDELVNSRVEAMLEAIDARRSRAA